MLNDVPHRSTPWQPQRARHSACGSADWARATSRRLSPVPISARSASGARGAPAPCDSGRSMPGTAAERLAPDSQGRRLGPSNVAPSHRGTDNARLARGFSPSAERRRAVPRPGMTASHSAPGSLGAARVPSDAASFNARDRRGALGTRRLWCRRCAEADRCRAALYHAQSGHSPLGTGPSGPPPVSERHCAVTRSGRTLRARLPARGSPHGPRYAGPSHVRDCRGALVTGPV